MLIPSVYRQNDYESRQATGTLPFGDTMSKVEKSYKNVPWTYSPDGVLRSGDSVMIKNKKTAGFLVMNLADRCPGLLESYMLTTTT